MRRRRLTAAAVIAATISLVAGLAGCGGDDDTSAGGGGAATTAAATTAPSTTVPAPTAPATTAPATTAPATTSAAGGAAGDADAGLQVWNANGCGGCHTFAAANAQGQVGPDLGTALKGRSAAFIRQSIVEPNAQIAEGYPPNVMPEDYGEKLSDQQIADLVALLQQG